MSPWPENDEDRRRIVLAVQFLQNIEAGFAGNMHVKQDACRGAIPRHRKQRRSVGKTDDFVTSGRQDNGKGFADRGVVVDDEDLTAMRRFFGHMTSSLVRQKTTRTSTADLKSLQRRHKSRIGLFVRDVHLTHK